MICGIVAGNKAHLSEIARSLKEHITFKKMVEAGSTLALDNGEFTSHRGVSLITKRPRKSYSWGSF